MGDRLDGMARRAGEIELNRRACPSQATERDEPTTELTVAGGPRVRISPHRRVQCEPDFLAFDRRLPVEAVWQSPPDPAPVTGAGDPKGRRRTNSGTRTGGSVPIARGRANCATADRRRRLR